MNRFPLCQTTYGFRWGPLLVERCMSDKRAGVVVTVSLVMMRLANERIKSIEEQTRRAQAEASRALRTAQSQDAQTIIDHIGAAVYALRSAHPDAIQDFLRRHVVGYQETGVGAGE